MHMQTKWRVKQSLHNLQVDKLLYQDSVQSSSVSSTHESSADGQ